MLCGSQLIVIDFDRFDFGDPWEEFNRIVWCAQAAPPFASGIVDGYFDGDPPPAFWQCLAFYIGSNTLSSVYWAIDYGEEEIQVMLRQAGDVMDWYDGFQRVVPVGIPLFEYSNSPAFFRTRGCFGRCCCQLREITRSPWQQRRSQRAAAFTDSEAEALLDGDGGDQLDLHVDVIAGITISTPSGSLISPVTSVVRK